MASAKKRFTSHRETSRTSGKSKAKRFIIEYLISKHGDDITHYELISMMRLPPLGIKKNDQIEHTIRDLEKEEYLIESAYVKKNSTSIKVYRLREDERSFRNVFLEVLESPDRLNLVRSDYFSSFITEKNVSRWLDDWKGKESRILKEGLMLAEEEMGVESVFKPHFDVITRYLTDMLNDVAEVGMLTAVPILAYMLMNGREGAKRFWMFLQDLDSDYPELFEFGIKIIGRTEELV